MRKDKTSQCITSNQLISPCIPLRKKTTKSKGQKSLPIFNEYTMKTLSTWCRLHRQRYTIRHRNQCYFDKSRKNFRWAKRLRKEEEKKVHPCTKHWLRDIESNLSLVWNRTNWLIITLSLRKKRKKVPKKKRKAHDLRLAWLTWWRVHQ